MEEQAELRAADGLRLRAARWAPADPARAVVLLSHGYGEHLGRYGHVIAALVAAGYVVHGLDHRGHGRSAGRRASLRRFDDFVADFDLLANRAARRDPGLPRFLLGHSMGGLIAVRYALLHQHELAGLIISGAALQVGDQLSPVMLRAGGLLARLVPDLPLLGNRPGVLSRDPGVERRFLTDPLAYTGRVRVRFGHELRRAGQDALARAGTLTLPLLVFHGAADELTNPAGSERLAAAARSADKTLRLWPGLRHELFNEPEGPGVIAAVIAWLDAHLRPVPPVAPLAPTPEQS